MRRSYRQERYLGIIDSVRAAMPDAAITTDIIVGFPGETEEEYEDTVSLVKEVGFETMFAFMYSPRPFTKAASFDGQIPEEVKNRRLNALFDAHEKDAFQLAQKYDSTILNVLVEQINEQGKAQGRSTQNKLVYFLGSESLIGKTVPVKITFASPNVLRGELVQ
jgi:tRNA-2-methylthio-N6-dimethylallyladenosine synthase